MSIQRLHSFWKLLCTSFLLKCIDKKKFGEPLDMKKSMSIQLALFSYFNLFTQFLHDFTQSLHCM